jgi:dTDP-4-dehydrorhamnose 3,5-epimerase-like enzyme
MIFNDTKLKGASIIDLERRNDERGYFARAFCQREFSERGLKTIIAQANIASNLLKGTLRGIHFQYPPSADTKLVEWSAASLWWRSGGGWVDDGIRADVLGNEIGLLAEAVALQSVA